MTTKKQKIIEAILTEAGHLSRETLTAKQLVTLKKFVNSHLDTHGRYGYMFLTIPYYTKQFVPVDNIKMLATYVLDRNHIRTI